MDSSGNAYVTGYTQSDDFPTVNPTAGEPRTEYGNGFVAKLNAAGSALVYSTYLGGSNADDGNGIAVDSSGNAYVTGLHVLDRLSHRQPASGDQSTAPNTAFAVNSTPLVRPMV